MDISQFFFKYIEVFQIMIFFFAEVIADVIKGPEPLSWNSGVGTEGQSGRGVHMGVSNTVALFPCQHWLFVKRKHRDGWGLNDGEQ